MMDSLWLVVLLASHDVGEIHLGSHILISVESIPVNHSFFILSTDNNHLTNSCFGDSYNHSCRKPLSVSRNSFWEAYN